MTRLSRLYAIAETLRGRAPRLVTVADLARVHDVSTRTIQRDLQALMESGIPVRWQDGRGGGWSVDASMSLPPVNLTEEEATALLLAVRASTGSTPFWSAAQSAWTKISTALDPAGTGAVQKWEELVAVREAEPERETITRVVEQAVRHSHAVHLVYTGADGQRSDRIVEPWGLLSATGNWYLVAWCRTKEARRGFRLDRIVQATELDEKVQARNLREALWAENIPLVAPE